MDRCPWTGRELDVEKQRALDVRDQGSQLVRAQHAQGPQLVPETNETLERLRAQRTTAPRDPTGLREPVDRLHETRGVGQVAFDEGLVCGAWRVEVLLGGPRGASPAGSEVPRPVREGHEVRGTDTPACTRQE